MARHGGIAPRFDDEWVNLRDYHQMHLSEMGVPPREIYPRDAREAHDAIMDVYNARMERERVAERVRRGVTYQKEQEAARENWNTYLDSYASGRTNIVFIRHKEHIDQPLLTVEVSNEGGVKQCYGFNDDRLLTSSDQWKRGELEVWEKIYDGSARAFATAYEEHLKEHFDKNKQKERTTA
jgi:hypothetical protein